MLADTRIQQPVWRYRAESDPIPSISAITFITRFSRKPTYLLTYSTEQRPSWEANRFSASQEIPRILWNPKVHCHTHKGSPPVPVLRQLDPFHAPTSHFLKIQLNIILPSTPGSPKWSLSLTLPNQKPCIRLSSPPYVLHVPPILFSILSPEQYWVRGTDH